MKSIVIKKGSGFKRANKRNEEIPPTESAIISFLGFKNINHPFVHKKRFIVKEIAIVVFETKSKVIIERTKFNISTKHFNFDTSVGFHPECIGNRYIYEDCHNSMDYISALTKVNAILMYYNISRVLYDYNLPFYAIEEFFRTIEWNRNIYWIRTFLINQEIDCALNRAMYILNCLHATEKDDTCQQQCNDNEMGSKEEVGE